MKNSTLLRLFFISIGIPLARASSPSTSSFLTPKSKFNTAPSLVDTTNSVQAVQLEDQGIVVQGVPEESQVTGRDEQIKKLEASISSGEYDEASKFADEMNDEELLKCLCQVVTSLDHFRSLYVYLEQRNMVPDFLAHGEMTVVKEVIVETDLLETGDLGKCDSIYNAIVLSFKEDRHERVVGLFEAAKERPLWEDDFDVFVSSFFTVYPKEWDHVPLKRFLTLHGEEFSKQHPEIFEKVCGELVYALKCKPDNPNSQKLLIDLVGQPSLLTPAVFAGGFLYYAKDTPQANFIEYGYKEAIEEGLKGKYECGGSYLWAVMVDIFPNQFSGEYPSTDEARSIVLRNFKPTKQDREETWAKKHAPILLRHLEPLATELLPRDLLSIVAEYAITWILV